MDVRCDWLEGRKKQEVERWSPLDVSALNLYRRLRISLYRTRVDTDILNVFVVLSAWYSYTHWGFYRYGTVPAIHAGMTVQTLRYIVCLLIKSD